MNPPRIRVVDMEGLTELLDEIFKTEVTDEEIQHRFEHACKLAYRITRYALKYEKPLSGGLLKIACAHMESGKSSMDGTAGAIIMEATSEYLDLKQQQNRELFKKEFILALDLAVQSTRRHIEESYDTRTEQSAEKRSTQSPTTP